MATKRYRRTCTVCGKEYEFCPDCREYALQPAGGASAEGGKFSALLNGKILLDIRHHHAGHEAVEHLALGSGEIIHIRNVDHLADTPEAREGKGGQDGGADIVVYQQRCRRG